jgi:protein-disulfide isomerase
MNETRNDILIHMEEKTTEKIEEHVVIEDKRKEKRDLFLPISILVAAVLIGGAVVFAAFYKGGASPSPATTPPTDDTGTTTPVANATNTDVMTLGPRDAILGNVNAPVTMIEYGDYQCPYCGEEFFAQTEPEIVANYVNTGKVRFVFRNFAFLGAESTAAAEAAECAEDQNKLWAYHDALYTGKVADDAKGGSEDDGYFTNTLFINIATQLGLNVPTFTSCINSGKYANLVAQEKTDAEAQGVNSTPTFFINGQEVLGAQPYSAFQAVIDPLLNQ